MKYEFFYLIQVTELLPLVTEMTTTIAKFIRNVIIPIGVSMSVDAQWKFSLTNEGTQFN